MAAAYSNEDLCVSTADSPRRESANVESQGSASEMASLGDRNLQLWQHLRDNHGIVSWAEAQDLGANRAQIGAFVERGEWVKIAPATYRSSSCASSWIGDARAAAISTKGLVSHRSAAALWDLDGFERPKVEVSIARARRINRPDLIIHQTTQLGLAEETVRYGIPVTGIERTILDVAAVVGPRRLEWAVDAALRAKLVSWEDLYSVLARHSRKGRDGCGKLRSLLDVRYGDMAIPDSKWNRMVLQLLADAGLPQATPEHTIRHDGRFVGRVDLAFVNQRLAIELDSVKYHLNRQSFEADPRRKNDLMLAGWTVLTFTWSDYIDHPARLCRTVRSTLSKLRGSRNENRA